MKVRDGVDYSFQYKMLRLCVNQATMIATKTSTYKYKLRRSLSGLDVSVVNIGNIVLLNVNNLLGYHHICVHY